MSAIASIKGALAGLSSRLPWRFAAQRPAGARTIADVTDATDAALVTTLVNASPDLVALYDAARTIHMRAVMGVTYIRAAERKAIAAAVSRLEA